MGCASVKSGRERTDDKNKAADGAKPGLIPYESAAAGGVAATAAATAKVDRSHKYLQNGGAERTNNAKDGSAPSSGDDQQQKDQQQQREDDSQKRNAQAKEKHQNQCQTTEGKEDEQVKHQAKYLKIARHADVVALAADAERTGQCSIADVRVPGELRHLVLESFVVKRRRFMELMNIEVKRSDDLYSIPAPRLRGIEFSALAVRRSLYVRSLQQQQQQQQQQKAKLSKASSSLTLTTASSMQSIEKEPVRQNEVKAKTMLNRLNDQQQGLRLNASRMLTAKLTSMAKEQHSLKNSQSTISNMQHRHSNGAVSLNHQSQPV